MIESMIDDLEQADPTTDCELICDIVEIIATHGTQNQLERACGLQIVQNCECASCSA